MWRVIKFCLNVEGPKERFIFQPLNEASAICDCFEKAFTRRDVSDKMLRDNCRMQWRIFRADQAF